MNSLYFVFCFVNACYYFVCWLLGLVLVLVLCYDNFDLLNCFLVGGCYVLF